MKNKKVESFNDTLVRIAYSAGQGGYYNGDMAEDMNHLIFISNKFEKEHKNTNWGEVDYTDTLDAFIETELFPANLAKHGELRLLMAHEDFGYYSFESLGKTNESPENWEILSYDKDGDNSYFLYGDEADYTHDCTVLGIEINW